MPRHDGSQEGQRRAEVDRYRDAARKALKRMEGAIGGAPGMIPQICKIGQVNRPRSFWLLDPRPFTHRIEFQQRCQRRIQILTDLFPVVLLNILSVFLSIDCEKI